LNIWMVDNNIGDRDRGNNDNIGYIVGRNYNEVMIVSILINMNISNKYINN